MLIYQHSYVISLILEETAGGGLKLIRLFFIAIPLHINLSFQNKKEH